MYEGSYSENGIGQNKENTMLTTIEEVKQYLDKDYWEKGSKSGYKDSFLNLWWNGRWCQCFNKIIPLHDKKLLDLGCGIGGFVTMSLLFGADSYGIDLSKYAIEKYQTECQRLQLPFDRCFEGSCHDLSRWSDESFDIIYSNQVFEHVPEELIDTLVKEIFRVAKKNAILWFALQFAYSQEHREELQKLDKTHITLYSHQWWDEKFKKIGLIPALDIDEKLRTQVTGVDHYSFFKEYQWTSLAYRKA